MKSAVMFKPCTAQVSFQFQSRVPLPDCPNVSFFFWLTQGITSHIQDFSGYHGKGLGVTQLVVHSQSESTTLWSQPSLAQRSPEGNDIDLTSCCSFQGHSNSPCNTGLPNEQRTHPCRTGHHPWKMRQDDVSPVSTHWGCGGNSTCTPLSACKRSMQNGVLP